MILVLVATGLESEAEPQDVYAQLQEARSGRRECQPGGSPELSRLNLRAEVPRIFRAARMLAIAASTAPYAEVAESVRPH